MTVGSGTSGVGGQVVAHSGRSTVNTGGAMFLSLVKALPPPQVLSPSSPRTQVQLAGLVP